MSETPPSPTETAASRYPQPSPEQFDAWRDSRDGDAGAEIAGAYTDFVRKEAWAYRFADNCGAVDATDLVQAGLVSVLVQAGKFDPARGTTFLTYAGKGIKGQVFEEFTAGRGAVTLSQADARRHTAIRREERTRRNSGNPAPLSETEIAELLSIEIGENERCITTDPSTTITARQLRYALALWDAASLEAIQGREGAAAVDNAILLTTPCPPTDEDTVNPALAAATVAELMDAAFTPASNAKESVRNRLARYREAIELHYLQGLTPQELGNVWGIGREGAAKTVKRALEFLKSFA